MQHTIPFVLIAGLASVAHAAILVTNTSVTHTFQGDSSFGYSTTTPLVNTSTGNHFNTWDGTVGAKLDINATSGSLRLDTAAWRNQLGFWSTRCPEGSLRFTVLDGNFSILFGGGSSSNTYGLFVLTNLATHQFRRLQFANTGGTIDGTLAFPAPPGEYELTFSSSNTPIMSHLSAGYVALAFNITPEPTCTLAMTSAAIIARRRRE